MRQQSFEAQRGPSWARFEELLARLDRGEAVDAQEFPTRYRQLCQDLALARDRLFTENLILRLNRLALRGHERLYSARPVSYGVVLDFVLRDFPRAVRREGRIAGLFVLLFFGSLAACAVAVQIWPDVTHRLLGSEAMRSLDGMYGDDVTRRPSQNVQMFGFYIFNNVSIGFRTFAGGIFFGVGSLFIMLFNAIYLGLATGYVIEQDMSEPFFQFVSGHSSLELVAIVLAAVAGMRLGLGLIAPGRRSRRESLRLAAHTALPLVYGVAGMLVLAAAIEGFWSASGFDPRVHYAVGGALWVGLALYFLLAGRGSFAEDAPEGRPHAA